MSSTPSHLSRPHPGMRRPYWVAAVFLAMAGLVGGCGDVPSTTARTPTPSVAPVTPTAPTPTPRTAKPTPKPTPTTKPTPTPTPTGPASQALRVETRLDALGYPTGTVDGVVSARTRQALCAWRETNGLPGGRGPLTGRDAESVLSATTRPYAAKPDGLYVSKTCQILYQVTDHSYRRIVRVSTGAAGYDTPSGTGHVWRKWAGWHESSLYEEAWMYDALYFRTDHPGIALHGSSTNSLVHSSPASHGCVRVWRPDVHEIFAETPIGTPVVVYGAY